jgi:AcrR family transcriptional regulator
MKPADSVSPREEGLRARKRRELRARLVAIAGRRFAEQGYDATNMREIAEEAGVAYQTLYNHFPNKARLALIWLMGLMDGVTAEVGALGAGTTGDPVAAIVNAADHYVRFVARLDRRLWREATSEYLHAPEESSELNLLKLLGPHTQLVELLGAERDAGALRADADLDTLADVVFVLIDHAVLRFVVIDDMTLEATLAGLQAQLELVLRPQLALP